MNFTLTEREAVNLEHWLKGHKCDCELVDAVQVGDMPQPTLTYSFAPTALGMVKKVRCACGSERDITDYSSW